MRSKRTVGSRALEAYSTHTPEKIRRHTDKVIRTGARIIRKINGPGTKAKGEAWLSRRKKMIKGR
jgi:hypothetical protein